MEQSRRLGQRRPRQAAPRRLQPVRRRSFRLAALGQMMRQQLRLLRHGLRIERFEGARNAQVQAAPVVAHQAVIGRVAQQGVAEGVASAPSTELVWISTPASRSVASG